MKILFNFMMILLVAAAMAFSACGGGGSNGGGDESEKAGTPALSGGTSGTYIVGTTVALTSSTEGATFRYTIDNSDPKTSGTAVSGSSIKIDSSITLKAYASKDGFVDSDVMELPITALNLYVAAYWRNEAETEWEGSYLSNGVKKVLFTTDSEVNAISVTNSIVYVVGNVNGKACYWTDGSKNDLSSNSSNANDIFISGDNVYISGGDNSRPCYWKDGDITYLDRVGSNNAEADAIFYDGITVFAAGNCFNINNKQTSCYWTGTSLQQMDPAAVAGDDLSARGIIVEGADVYVAGQYYNGSKIVPACWINGEITELSTKEGEANNVVKIGSDVYISGSYTSGGNDFSCFWKNGEKKDVLDFTERPHLFNYNNELFIVGVSGGKVCYYKGDVKFNLYQIGELKIEDVYLSH